MGKILVLNDREYELITNYKDAFNKEDFISKFTDYFYDYDYVVGDIAYGKLRLKGFYDPTNKRVNKINNFKNFDNYLKNNCANDCKYFVLKKIVEEK